MLPRLNTLCLSAFCLIPEHFQDFRFHCRGCYAVFKRWLLLSRLHQCHETKTPFLETQQKIRGLKSRSGLFPSCLCSFARTDRLLLYFFGIHSLSVSSNPQGTLEDPQSLYPQKNLMKRYTYIYFAWNQLTRCSIGFSPLSTAHSRILQHSPIQPSTQGVSAWPLKDHTVSG